MKNRLFLPMLAATAAICLASPVMATDSAQDFVNKASAGGMFEVESSKVAEANAQAANVREFAQKMISDHGAANAKLASIATAQKLTVPLELDDKHKGDVDALKSGQNPVDEAYVKLQRDAHAEAVKLFESYADNGDNAELKAFAQQTVPTLKMHQEMVEKIASKIVAPNAQKPKVTVGDDPEPAPPFPGANSFTEGQAKTRIQDAGFADVSKLTKDEQGIWRGQATKNGKTTGVALDYKGNVVVMSN